MAIFGSIVWPSLEEPLWSLKWGLPDQPDIEGIVITDAYYRGREVFYKASLPAIRVQYDSQPDGTCGPYMDRLCYENAGTTCRCPSTKVCVYSTISNGFRGLNVESYHLDDPFLSNYHITQRWIFWENGVIYPRLFSAGLQCNANHRHHIYWRFDFDIDGRFNDLVLEYNIQSGNVGWGNGWHPKTAETSSTKLHHSRRAWAIMDKSSGRGYFIKPGPNDRPADTFSNRDIWIMRYHFNEDRHGQQGDPYNDGLSTYINGENIDGQDVVVWYCSHLYHNRSDPGDDWHGTGPHLLPFGSWD
jgi:Cu2+-containing amine oxidase